MIGAVTPSWCSSQASATSGPCRRAFLLLAQHAAEQPAVQGRPRDHADAVVPRRGQHLQLDPPRCQVVQRLLAHQPEEVPLTRRLLCLREVPPGEVRRPEVQHLSLLPQDTERLPDLVPRRVPVDVVHLVQVDVVGLQAPQ